MKSPKRRWHRWTRSTRGSAAYLTVLHDLARERAAGVDARVRAGAHCRWRACPIAVKDNMCLTGTRTTCGSKILEHWVAPYTATAVAAHARRRRHSDRQGQLDEFAMGSSCENSALGVTRNPVRSRARSGRIERRVGRGRCRV